MKDKEIFGVIIPSECRCNKYEPKSIKGVIDLSCRNCNGEQREMIFR